jgi:hypothetical protein
VFEGVVAHTRGTAEIRLRASRPGPAEQRLLGALPLSGTPGVQRQHREAAENPKMSCALLRTESHEGTRAEWHKVRSGG